MTESELDIDEPSAGRNTRLLIGGFVAVIVLGVAVGLVVALRNPSHHGHGHRSGTALGAGLFVVAVIFVGQALWLRRRFRATANRQLLQYGWNRRRRVARALRKGQPISAQDWPVATSIATIVRRQAWTVRLFPAVVLLWGVLAVTHHGVMRWMYLAAALMGIVCVPLSIKQRRAVLTTYDREVIERQA